MEAISADGNAMVGFGLDPEGLGSMWVASAPTGISFEAIVLADCNLDESLNVLDLQCVSSLDARDALLDSLGSLPGDLDGVNGVNFNDFLTLAKNFGEPDATYADGNVDLQNGVDFPDFLELASNFEKKPNLVATVPETACTLHAFLAIAWCLLLSQRESRFHLCP